MRPPRNVPKVRPSDVRPFRPGDRAVLWFGRNLIEGTVALIYVNHQNGDLYAILDLGHQRFRQYPLWQLLPVGLTRLTLHHLFYTIRMLWKKACARPH